MTDEKVKTISSIAIKVQTKEQLDKCRKYGRETYDEIIVRLISQVASRKGKKTKGE